MTLRLSYRFPNQFKDRRVVEEERSECGVYIALVRLLGLRF